MDKQRTGGGLEEKEMGQGRRCVERVRGRGGRYHS